MSVLIVSASIFACNMTPAFLDNVVGAPVVGGGQDQGDGASGFGDNTAGVGEENPVGATQGASEASPVEEGNSSLVAEAQVVGTRLNEALPITLSAIAPDGAPSTYSYSIDDGPVHGMLQGTPPDVVYVPDDGYVGFDAFSFHADSGHPAGASNTADVRIWVIDEQNLSGRTVHGHLVPGDTDTWSFEGVAGQRVLLKLACLWHSLSVYPPGGGQAEVTGKRIDWQLQTTGRYTIVVEGGAFEGDYDLTLLVLSGQHASLADLDGGEIPIDRTLFGSAAPTSDLDAFTFEGTVGRRVVIKLAGLWPSMMLYGPGEIGVETTGNDIDWQLQATGRYTIVVEAGAFDGNYTLTLQQF